MYNYLFENSAAYSVMETNRKIFSPVRNMILFGEKWSKSPYNPMIGTAAGNKFKAAIEITERLTRSYPKPEFGITETIINGKKIVITEKNILKKTFCQLLHFEKKSSIKLPRMLVVAPMSGHHATLLRGTVEGLLPFYDVYITDWLDVRYIPLSEGSFDLDDYIDYCIEFMELLAPRLHVMAVCQPTVPILAGTAIMSAENNPKIPASLILMGGPIDTRKRPTGINTFAIQRSMNWFESNLISRVPIDFPGAGRAVYPGSFQLMGFVMMNVKRHIEAHIKLYKTVAEGDEEKAVPQRKFYDEYFSVMDMPAEFYLQTINTVFKEHALPKGKMISRGRKVDPKAITKTALFGIEGELDDIAGVGQTKAALALCSRIPDHNKHYYLQKDVGHYGVFSGRRFKEQVIPEINKFICNIK